MRHHAHLGRKALVHLTLAGCLFAAGCQQSPAFSRYVPTKTFDQIKPGVTQAWWLTTTFGQPIARTPQDGHVEHWQWLYRAEKHADGWAVLFYNSGVKPDEYAKYGQAYAVIKDGTLMELHMGDRENDFGGDWAVGKGTVVAGNSTFHSGR